MESVFNQNTDSEYEIILVDDGSSDGSFRLCDRLAEKNSCIRVVHQENQGVSAARNRGIREARGEYLLFLDADDSWDESLLRHMDLATKDNPDIVEFGYRTIYEDGQVTEQLPPPVLEEESGREYVTRILDRGTMPVRSCWASAHRKSFLAEYEIEFPRDIIFGEDILFRMRELVKAKNICTVDAALYMYRRNAASATRNMSLKKMQDVCTVWYEIYQLFPKPIVADFYCMNLISVAELDRNDARTLLPLMEQNRSILSAVRGKKPQIACAAFKVLGYYHGARLIKFLIGVKNG